ncbi:MAG: hypothetical protein HYW78_01295 [Parcubacteria group bacterium]|nr:hypothetical protein [Parcubacteria group bacterium]
MTKITALSGHTIEVEEGSLFGLRSGDIVTDLKKGTSWNGKAVRIEGYRKIEETGALELWGTPLQNPYDVSVEKIVCMRTKRA